MKTLRDLTRFDIAAIAILFFGGLVYLWNAPVWGNYIGENQYGDSEFWWNGAIHFARGIFADNPGRGFRPGYFIIGGLSIPILGDNFLVFHKFLLVWFLSTVIALYLVLSRVWNRTLAFSSLAMLVFCPYTAEWMAISTTDSVGLLLHLLALVFLILALEPESEPRTLISKRRILFGIGFGLAFSMATLTRPLVTPFLGVVGIVILLGLKESWKSRLQTLVLVVSSSVFLIFGWMAIQKAAVGAWTISTNDASAFYAASDPKIQVWNNEMYAEVEKSVHTKDGPQAVSEARLNQEFWTLTLKNYVTHWQYHLQRMPSHFYSIAKFDSIVSAFGQGRHYWRGFVYLAFGFYFIFFMVSRNWGKLALVIVLTWAYSRYPQMTGLVVLAGLGSAILRYLVWRKDLAFFLIAGFWLIGTLALAAVGGTWSATGPENAEINALGYRLGSQIFFANDIMRFYFFFLLLGPLKEWGTKIVLGSGFVIKRSRQALLAVTFIVFICGGAAVGFNWSARQQGAGVLFPSADSLPQSLFAKEASPSPWSPLWTTGMTSSFVWSLPGQQRSQMLFYIQTQVLPVTMHPQRRLVELHRSVLSRDWRYRQGAFLLRKFPDPPSNSNQVYYQNEMVIQAYVPLALDGKSYDLSRLERFPLEISGSRLFGLKDLQATAGSLVWKVDSGPRLYERRFLLAPNEKSQAELVIDVSQYTGTRKLILESIEPVSEAAERVNLTPGQVLVLSRGQQVLSSDIQFKKKIEIDLGDPKVDQVRMKWSGLEKQGLYLYELRIQADDRAIPRL